jgi:hypothetical protein
VIDANSEPAVVFYALKIICFLGNGKCYGNLCRVRGVSVEEMGDLYSSKRFAT